jgi:hypothetical protein
MRKLALAALALAIVPAACQAPLRVGRPSSFASARCRRANGRRSGFIFAMCSRCTPSVGRAPINAALSSNRRQIESMR